MDGGMDGGMVGGMYRWAFSRHDAAHSVPPGRKHISLVAMLHAFQGWDEKNPYKITGQVLFCSPWSCPNLEHISPYKPVVK